MINILNIRYIISKSVNHHTPGLGNSCSYFLATCLHWDSHHGVNESLLTLPNPCTNIFPVGFSKSGWTKGKSFRKTYFKNLLAKFFLGQAVKQVSFLNKKTHQASLKKNSERFSPCISPTSHLHPFQVDGSRTNGFSHLDGVTCNTENKSTN